VIDWLKSLFEGESHKKFKEARKDLHDNRNEMQRSIASAKQSGKKSSAALKVAEHALKTLKRHEDYFIDED
jgi:uncharacterized protein YukE